MKQENLLLLIGILVIALSSCKEEQIVDDRNKAIFDHYKKNAQKFVITSKGKQTIKGKEGTKITFDISALKLKNGDKLPGDIEIELTEYYKPSDMLLANLSTSSDNQLIETGGMINLSVSSKGKEVVIKKGKNIEIVFSSKEKADMEVFYGNPNKGQMNWLPESKPVQISKAGFFAQQQEDYSVTESDTISFEEEVVEQDRTARNTILKSTKFGWINCDRFLELDDLSTIKIKYDTVFEPSAYLVFKEINSIMPCNYKKTYGEFINLPVGHEATLITFCIDGEKTYFYSKDIVIGDKKEEIAELNEVSMDNIGKKIEKLTE